MDKSTPRPWGMDKPDVAGEYTSPAENGRIWGTTIRSSDRAAVTHLTWCDKYAENLLNAALIVRAVNAHDVLIEALRHMLEGRAGCRDKARAAIALATKE